MGKSLGGSYLPGADYDRTGSTDSNGTYTAPTLTDPAATSTGVMITKLGTFTEDDTSTSHVCTIAIPAGAILHNITVTNSVLWGATSAALDVGDTADGNGYFAAVNCKATDLAVGEVLDTSASTNWGGKEGAYLVAASGVRGPVATNFGNYYAAGSNIVGTMTVGTPAVTTGRTWMSVTYSVGTVVAAVAS